MRFSAVSLLALPLLSVVAQQESPIEQVKAQAQYWFEKIQSFLPNPAEAHSPEAAAAKVGGKTLNVLTLSGWEHTIRSSVKASSTKPEEWWVFITGGNKTCFGHCLQSEIAFNETAALWSINPTAPHLAYLNCEAQPVLCNSWAVGPPSVYIFEVSAPPAPVDVYVHYLNSTTTTVKTFTDLHSSKAWKETPPYQGYFHPFDGELVKYGVAVPIGYVIWFFGVVPSWFFMIGISFLSRTVMSRRGLGPQPPRPAAAAPPAR